MRFKKTILKEIHKKRKWQLWYCLNEKIEEEKDWERLSDDMMRIVEFGANSHEEALNRTLSIIKNSVKRCSRRFISTVSLSPIEPLPRRETISTDELYRMKRKYSFSPEKILKIKDPKECFVQGYGPEIARKLDEGLKEAVAEK